MDLISGSELWFLTTVALMVFSMRACFFKEFFYKTIRQQMRFFWKRPLPYLDKDMPGIYKLWANK